jgi:hypothetical protein
MGWEAIISILTIFIGAPSVVFGFILLGRRERNRIELQHLRIREAEVALERDRLHVDALREENRKLDRMIEHRIDMQ